MVEFSNSTWRNGISPGDSGSGFYIYDKTKQKWLLLGVTSKADLQNKLSSGIAVATKKDFDDFKKEKEWELNLNGGDNWTYEKSVGAAAKFKQNGNNEKQPDMNKDIVFSGGGTIDVKADMDLLVSSQVGGLVFKKNGGSGETTYTIKSTDKKGFNGSGLDIDREIAEVDSISMIKRSKNGYYLA